MASPRQQTEDPHPTQVQPPVSATAPAPPKKEGLSIQTLVIAAIASASAALVVSRVWGAGTIFASAMTPVIVALVSEILRKPAESDLVKRPLTMARSAVTSSTPVVFTDRGREASAPVDEGPAPAPADMRIYSSGSNKVRTPRSPRRKLHLKVAIVTGLIAFLIAALALTLPELIFGQSVANNSRGTTVFGGSSSKSSSSSDEKKDEESGSSSESGQDQQQDETTPQDSTSDSSGDETAPSDEGGSSTQIDPAPSGEQVPPPTTTTPTTPTAPQQTTPAPTTPTPTP